MRPDTKAMSDRAADIDRDVSNVRLRDDVLLLCARVEALEAALRRIADGDYPTDPHGHARIARAALEDAP